MQKQMNNTLKQRFPELDTLRGLAAILVVLFHCVLATEQWGSVFLLGTAGVDLFFMISGFVILLSIQKVASAKQFIVNRFARLYPTYWTVVSFTFLLIISEFIFGFPDAHVDLLQYLVNLSMFQYYFGVNDLDGPYWTMIVEMLFYMFMLVLYRFKWLNALTPIGLVLSLATAGLCNFYYEAAHMKEVIYWFPLLPFIPLFVAGSLFYKLYTNRAQIGYTYLLLVVFLLCQIALFPYAGRSNYFISMQQYAWLLTSFFLLFVFFVHGKLIWIVNPISLFYGKISFAFYLIHQHITIIIILPFCMNHLGMSFWATVLCVVFPVVTALAALITYKIEVPITKKIKEVLSIKY